MSAVKKAYYSSVEILVSFWGTGQNRLGLTAHFCPEAPLCRLISIVSKLKNLSITSDASISVHLISKTNEGIYLYIYIYIYILYVFFSWIQLSGKTRWIFVCEHMGTVYAWIYVPFPPVIQLPSSNTPPVRHLVWTPSWPVISRVRLRPGLYRHLLALQSPEKHSWLQVFTIHCFTCPCDEVGLKSNMKRLQADKCHSEQTGSDGHIHMKWIHIVNPLPCCLFYKSHPVNDLFSQCIARCFTSVLVFQSHDFL